MEGSVSCIYFTRLALKDSEFIAKVMLNDVLKPQIQERKKKKKQNFSGWQKVVWSADSALQRPEYLPGPWGYLKHTGKPLGLGRYRLTAASKPVRIARDPRALASPLIILII